jgi:hypothetical protein
VGVVKARRREQKTIEATEASRGSESYLTIGREPSPMVEK